MVNNMKQYIKDKHVINATEKAYNVIYKEQGYIPYNELIQEAEEKEEVTKDIFKMKKDELIVIAKENGIEIPEDAKKEDIIKLIQEAEEKEEASE